MKWVKEDAAKGKYILHSFQGWEEGEEVDASLAA